MTDKERFIAMLARAGIGYTHNGDEKVLITHDTCNGGYSVVFTFTREHALKDIFPFE